MLAATVRSSRERSSGRPRIGAIVLCRLDSRRLPRKALRRIGGRTLLEIVVERCAKVRGLDRIVVATSDRTCDDPLERFCRSRGWDVYRGATRDVAGRALTCARSRRLDFFARVNADSPLLDPALLTRAVALARRERPDLVTNLRPRSFPYGVSIELVRTEALARAHARMRSTADREHVTRYLYRNAGSFRVRNLTARGPDRSGRRLTVDTPEDLARLRAAMRALHRPPTEVSYGELLLHLEENA